MAKVPSMAFVFTNAKSPLNGFCVYKWQKSPQWLLYLQMAKVPSLAFVFTNAKSPLNGFCIYKWQKSPQWLPKMCY
jgi:hypothetical protein